MTWTIALAALVISSVIPNVVAGPNACYDQAGIRVPKLPGTKVVLADRTTDVSAFASQLSGRVLDWGRPGERFVIIVFGGNLRGLLEVVFDESVLLEKLPADVERDVKMRTLEMFRVCIRRAATEQRLRLEEALSRTFAAPSTNRDDQSPVLEAIAAVASIYTDAPRGQLGLALISDGIEHVPARQRGGRTFYEVVGSDRVRTIDANAELSSIKAANLLPVLDGVRVWHIALGQPGVSATGNSRPRNVLELLALREFYIAYWAATHATLVDIGMPLPLRPLR